MSDEPEMTMEQLAEDWKGLKARAKESLGPMASSADIAKFMRMELLPFLENHVQQSIEMDGCIEDMMYKQDDVLQPETASIFAAVIVGGRALADVVVELAPKGPDGKLADASLAEKLKTFLQMAMGAERTLEEITLPEDPDDADEGEDDPDEDDEGDEDDADDEDDQDDEGEKK